jgi:hypothetical protein
MEEEKKQENETPKNEEEEESSETPEEKTEEKSDSKELQSALAQKEHFRKKYEKAQEELSKHNVPQETKDASKEPEQNPMEIVKLAKALEKFNEEEIEFVTRNATDKSVDGILKAAKDEWVNDAITARREKVAKENSIPEPSTKQEAVESKEKKSLRDMSIDEKAEYLAKQGFVNPFPKPRPPQ